MESTFQHVVLGSQAGLAYRHHLELLLCQTCVLFPPNCNRLRRFDSTKVRHRLGANRGGGGCRTVEKRRVLGGGADGDDKKKKKKLTRVELMWVVVVLVHFLVSPPH
ncbi:hypothetical protein HanHA300_Chr03g0106381 [Helianthus annuus]|nr:hypothetical protein HanHA300_Chr03g0106381 [Helianthus annuus]KAJ0609271.1 hypothetical protein HanHA89_Chr03g0118091 [Helianthus annuus]KAJ0769329.1 hypothetical protein HanLR1_Chr03g0111461 [Helianthus annuus]